VSDDKPSFWTTLPGILTGITGVLTALAGLLLAIHQFPSFWADKPESQEKILLGRLDVLERTSDACPNNSWYSYVLDFSRLGDITRDYVRYVQQNPTRADKDNQVLHRLRSTLGVIRTRNEPGTKYFDRSDIHSRKLPDKFGRILDSIESSKRAGTFADDESVFESAVQNWFSEAGFPASATSIVASCRFG
jgi:hypothetical protein